MLFKFVFPCDIESHQNHSLEFGILCFSVSWGYVSMLSWRYDRTTHCSSHCSAWWSTATWRNSIAMLTLSTSRTALDWTSPIMKWPSNSTPRYWSRSAKSGWHVWIGFVTDLTEPCIWKVSAIHDLTVSASLCTGRNTDKYSKISRKDHLKFRSPHY